MIDNNSSISSSNSSSAAAAAVNKGLPKSCNHDGADYSKDDTRALLHALQSELRARGAVGPSGIHMMSHKFLRERRASTVNDEDQDQNEDRPKEDLNKHPSALVDFIFPPRAKGMLTRAVSAGAGGAYNGKKQVASSRQNRNQTHPRSSSSLMPSSSPFMASLSTLLGEEIADMTTNESASWQNARSTESIKKEHDENLAAAREYAVTMRRLSTLNTDDTKPCRKPRRSNTSSSDSSTQRSSSRSSSFGNLAHAFVDTIEAALNDLSEEATGSTASSNNYSTEFVTSELSATSNTHREEEHTAGTELQDLRNSRNGSSLGNSSCSDHPNTRRSRSPSTVAARGA
jgi:hypothetical protein